MVCHEIEDIIGIPALDAPRISAKTGLNVEQVLEKVRAAREAGERGKAAQLAQLLAESSASPN